MKEKLKNCDHLTICNRTDLMADNEFIDKEIMAKKCDLVRCFRSNICKQILALLNQGKRKEATDKLNI